MKKQFINKEIFNKTSRDHPIPVCSNIMSIMEIGCIIQAGYEDPFYSENNSSEGYFYLKIIEKRLETDEEFEERVKERELQKEEYNKKRYENYLKLKEEFEGENRELTSESSIRLKIGELKNKINKWDELAKDNDERNKHNLSTSERQDWIDELSDLENE